MTADREQASGPMLHPTIRNKLEKKALGPIEMSAQPTATVRRSLLLG